ncbi:hypothetical protein Z517_04574 [Fonsecaea pedrosoi CBS 271.37]|uniref:Fucose-specific lectin n=1 Tax=Fonsecaea pedrosoi CBS 271.37 TaxID=1442368 RepID=A0A0D2GKY3_9EURO|nr:uncharacterized protein Z517_04574 [Fonsecaea pedrosoi CBS 271.37]KIW81548.1 hypothetical protein Z517_04574 [Fonsecaea pedrosoi CBS 271.37]
MASLKLLPDSGITSMVMGNDIFAFVQTYEGDIYQFVGNVENSSVFYGSRKKSNVIIERLKGMNPKPDAPKLFTPIAAVSFTDQLNKPMSERYVFYLDDKNILHDQYDLGNGDYQHGKLAELKIECAHYSSLAAVTIRGDVVNHMCVFYQALTRDGAVKMVSFAGIHRTWQHGGANLRDPPLYGTSLSAVPPRAGILGRSGSDKSNQGQPIYYLQLDSHALGSGQGTAEPLPLAGYDCDGKPVAFSPHTSLTAVDNGIHLHLIYKSHSGQVKAVRIDPKEGLLLPELFFHDVNVAPRSAIAACIAPNTGTTTSIVLFYQALDPDSRKVQMAARVVYKSATAATDTQWNVSEKEVLGE